MDETQCRVCLGESNDISIFKRINDTPIDEMLLTVSNVKVSQDDNFSKVLCKKCVSDAYNAYSFRKKCLDTERTLRGLQKKLEEIQNAHAKMYEMKHEQSISDDVYEEEVVKDEVVQDENVDIKVLYQDVIEESYITYEVDEDEVAAGFIEEYEHVEYLETDVSQQIFENIEGEESKTRKNYTCEYCKPTITFKTDLGLETHMFDEHQIGMNPLYCETCNMIFPVKSTDSEEFIHRNVLKHTRHHLDGKFHPCKKCFEVFKTLKQLENHEKTHTTDGSTQFRCKSCCSSFQSYSKLSQHLSESQCREANEKSFKCYICNQVFAQGIAKKKHVMEDHNDKAGADCPLCLRCKIPSAVSFEKHYRTHFIHPRFCCSFCGRSFYESDRLQTHIRRSHDKTSLICFWCNKPFRDKSGITRHIMGVHFNARNYKCSICSKAFTARYNLKEHMFSVHKMAASVYKCEICNQDFLYRKQYVRHRASCVSGVSPEKRKR